MSATRRASGREYPSDIAFTPAVKAIQEQKGSRNSYARMERSGGWQTTVTPELDGVSGGPGHVLSRHRERRGAAVHPVSRRLAGVPQGARRAYAWRSPTSAATGSTSRSAICPRIRRRLSS